jgi:hypothetical protein
VVCGAENVCTPALKGVLGTKEGFEYKTKCSHAYMRTVKESLNSCQRRMDDSYHIWIAHCINSARLSEVDDL